MASSGFSICSIMSSTNSDSFTSSFSILFYFFMIAVIRTSTTMLNKSGEVGHLCLLLDLCLFFFNVGLNSSALLTTIVLN